MPDTIETFTNDRLSPKSFPGQERRKSGKFGASLTLAKGTVLAQKTSDSLLYAYAYPNVVQTITTTGSLSAGVVLLSAIKSDGSRKIVSVAYNDSAATIQTALNAALGTSAVAVAGTMASFTVTFSGTNYAAKPQPLMGVDVSNATGATAASVTDSTAYDGTEKPVGFSEFAIKTDASSKVFLGNESATANVRLTPLREAPYFIAGTFDTTELTGYDAQAGVYLGAKSVGTNLINIAF